MRIISKFRDYYDSVQGMGIDNTLIYNRTTTISDDGDIDVHNLCGILKEPMEMWGYRHFTTFEGVRLHYTDFHTIQPTCQRITVVFCGKVYNVIVFKRDGVIRLCNNEQQIIDCLTDWKQKTILSSSKNRSSTFKQMVRWVEMDTSNFNSNALLVKFDCPVLFIAYVTPMLATSSSPALQITTNPRLMDINFQSIVPTYDAFQSISMYLGNQLARELDIPSAIPDKYKIISKGFGDESFKTRKGTKKPRCKDI